MELKRASGDLMGAAHLAALAHEDTPEPVRDGPEHEDPEPTGPRWFQKMWGAFEDVDAYLTKVVYGDDRMHG